MALGAVSEVILEQYKKALFPIVFTFGRETFNKALHSENAPLPIVSALGSEMEASAWHKLNVLSPMVMAAGSDNETSDIQPLNVELPKVNTFGRDRFCTEHPANAQSPTVVTSGITTVRRAVQL